MKRTKPAFFPKTPYEGSLLQSLGNFTDFIRFVRREPKL
jgi:hypothetical protein